VGPARRLGELKDPWTGTWLPMGQIVKAIYPFYRENFYLLYSIYLIKTFISLIKASLPIEHKKS
jgi:hypothetical protein